MRRLVALLLAVFTLAACGDDGGGVSDVSVAEAAELVASDDQVTILDVRTPEEFAAGHLAGAVNLDVQAPDFDDRLADLPKDAAYLVYCRSGNRSAAASQRMSDAGFTDVTNVTGGGFDALVTAGAPT